MREPRNRTVGGVSNTTNRNVPVPTVRKRQLVRPKGGGIIGGWSQGLHCAAVATLSRAGQSVRLRLGALRARTARSVSLENPARGVQSHRPSEAAWA